MRKTFETVGNAAYCRRSWRIASHVRCVEGPDPTSVVIAACVRFETPSFAKAELRCDLTVALAMCSSSAISTFVMPLATHARISCSRCVRSCVPFIDGAQANVADRATLGFGARGSSEPGGSYDPCGSNFGLGAWIAQPGHSS